MELRYTPIKNYVHTAEALIRHAGLVERVTPIATKPFDPATDIGNFNPLGTVPTLVRDDGSAIFGGPMLYEYLDSLSHGPSLYPTGAQRWPTLTRLWVADGLFDSFVKLIIEAWEPRETQRRAYIDRQWTKVVRCLDWLEADRATAPAARDIGQMRAIGAIAFLALKMQQVGTGAIGGVDPHYDWRTDRPNLAAWYASESVEPMFNQPLIPWESLP